MRYRLLALDLDGTLLDPYGTLTGTARKAVAAAQRAGLQVVLCTGRRFRTTLPVLRELGLDGCVVVNNGSVVKDVASERTLYQSYLPDALYPEVLEIMREPGPPLVYVDRYHEDTDFLTEPEGDVHPYQAEYLEDHAEHCRFVDDLAEVRRDDVILLSQMADAETLQPLRERARRVLGTRVRTHLLLNKNYQGLILEVFSPHSGKWSALARVASDAGIRPEEIAAIGDDSNDVELLQHAGLGIAMGNGVREAKAAADLVVRSNAEGGVAEAVQRVLRER
jgi:Cof subfamily protein (haloacid dehalogenase superfamily)